MWKVNLAQKCGTLTQISPMVALSSGDYPYTNAYSFSSNGLFTPYGSYNETVCFLFNFLK